MNTNRAYSIISKTSAGAKNLLTDRELEYLSMVALGYRNNIIAENLFVTNSTVKKTLENIYKKLNAKDRANAVMIALTNKILSSQTLYEFTESHNLINEETVKT